MKILHVLDHSLPLHSGYTFRSRNLFREQRRMGCRPVVVTSPKHEAGLEAGYCPIAEEIDGILYYRSGATPSLPVPVAGELTLMQRLYSRLMDVIRMERPDIIHAHSPVLNAFPAIRAARKHGLPVVYEIRAFWEDAAVDHGTYAEGSWKYRLTQSLETRVCQHVDHIAILCDGLKQDLVGRGIPAAKITPVFNGVNIDDFKPVAPDADFARQWNLSGRRIIGFIGSFYRYEGLDLLVDAFADVVERYPDVMLLLVGGGETAGELKSQVRRRKLGDRVVMSGRTPHQRVPGIYALIDILVYPRYSMRLTELVTPLKPLEAMAMGKAVVASDVGGHREQIVDGENGALFRAGDRQALAAVLGELLAADERRDQLAAAGRHWVTQKSWERTTAVYQEIYRNI